MNENLIKPDQAILDTRTEKIAACASSLSYAKENHSPNSKFTKYKTALENELKQADQTLENITPFYKKGNKINQAGYIIETDKTVIVCYHGTQFNKFFTSGFKEVFHDMQITRTKMKFGDKEGGVHLGFKKERDASKDDMFTKLEKATKGNNKRILCTGHSLGGALSQMLALDLESNNPGFKNRILAAITFGSPRVFNAQAAKIYNEYGLNKKTLRVEQKVDFVTKMVPSMFFAEVGFILRMHARPEEMFYRIIHSMKAYREVSKNIANLKSIQETLLKLSAAPVTMEEYYKSSMNLTQKQFLALFSAAKQSIDDSSFIKNYASPFLNKMPQQTPLSIPKKNALRNGPHAKRGARGR